MLPIKWQFASYTVEAIACPSQGLLATLKIGSFTYQAKIEGFPSISYEKLVKIPFRKAFYPVVSRLGDGNWRVRFESRGLGGGCFDWLRCCFGSSEYETSYRELSPKPPLAKKHFNVAKRVSTHNTVELNALPEANSIASLQITDLEWELLAAHPILIFNKRTEGVIGVRIDKEKQRAYFEGRTTDPSLYMSEEESYGMINTTLNLIRDPDYTSLWTQQFILKMVVDDQPYRLLGVSLVFPVSETEVKELPILQADPQ